MYLTLKPRKGFRRLYKYQPMSKSAQSSPIVFRSVVAVALLTSAAAAAFLIWAKRPTTQSRKLIGRCDDALDVLEHRSPSYNLGELRHTA